MFVNSWMKYINEIVKSSQQMLNKLTSKMIRKSKLLNNYIKKKNCVLYARKKNVPNENEGFQCFGIFDLLFKTIKLK